MLKKIILSLILFYAILGFVIIPIVAKPQIIDIISKETNARIEIDSVYFNPFAFLFEISGLKLSSQDDKELLSLKSISLNIEAYSLVNSAIHIKSFILEEPKISLVLYKDKKINFTSIVKSSSDSKPKKSSEPATHMPRIIIDKIAIVDGSLNYQD